MSNFYLLLPSNVPGGTLSNFTVKLPDRISLQGEWEVALVEIAYQNTWYNIRNSNDGYIAVVHFGEGQEIAQGTIAVNNYGAIADLLRALKEEINNVRLYKKWERPVPIKFKYNPSIGRVVVTTAPPHVYLYLSTRLSYMLGFDNAWVTKEYKVEGDRRISFAPHPPDIKGGFYFMYVYCSLVAPQIVGDKFAPLLKTLSVSSNFGDIVQRDFINPHYVPVIKKEFESIEINIKDDNGHLVPFNFGKTILKLHFRKKRQ